MNIFNLFSGVHGEVLRLTLLLPILVVLFAISSQLLKNRKRKSYLFLATFSRLNLIVTSSALCVGIGLSFFSNSQWISSILAGVSNLMFMGMIFGLLRIYAQTTKQTAVIFAGATLLSTTMTVFSMVLGLISNIIALGLIFYLYNDILRKGKYQYAPMLLFASGSVVGILQSLFDSSGFLAFIQTFCLVTSYLLIVLKLLDYSMFIMQSSYLSSITDSLTRLFNRKYFTRVLVNSMEKTNELGLLFLDIDDFKTLNDTQGHKAGDEVLQQVATILIEEVEGIGIAGRYGGEELIAMIQGTEQPLSDLAEEIRERIEKETSVTVSLGYTKYADGISSEVFIKMADEAMYAAKRAGKNRVMAFEDIVLAGTLEIS